MLIRTPWTVDNGFITLTFKVKRNRIEEAYGPHFEAWVAEKRPVLLGIEPPGLPGQPTPEGVKEAWGRPGASLRATCRDLQCTCL